MSLTLHAVMVTHQRGRQLRDYFDALAGQDRPIDRLWVIDNDPAESARWIIDGHGLTHTAVRYVATGENIGPAGGIAFGLHRVLAEAADADWVLTLDDDDPPRTHEMIGELERFAEQLLAEGVVVGGVGLCGGRFDARRGRLVTVETEELHGAVPTPWIGGNQLPCYRVGAVRRVGVFDPRLFINFEELDFGLRMWDLGLGLYAHGELWRRERSHLGRTGELTATMRVDRDPSWRRYYSLRNLVFLLRSRGHCGAAALVSARSLAKPLINLPRAPAAAVAHLRQNVRAIRDGWTGRLGRTVSPAAKPYVPRP